MSKFIVIAAVIGMVIFVPGLILGSTAVLLASLVPFAASAAGAVAAAV